MLSQVQLRPVPATGRDRDRPRGEPRYPEMKACRVSSPAAASRRRCISGSLHQGLGAGQQNDACFPGSDPSSERNRASAPSTSFRCPPFGDSFRKVCRQPHRNAQLTSSKNSDVLTKLSFLRTALGLRGTSNLRLNRRKLRHCQPVTPLLEHTYTRATSTACIKYAVSCDLRCGYHLRTPKVAHADSQRHRYRRVDPGGSRYLGKTASSRRPKPA